MISPVHIYKFFQQILAPLAKGMSGRNAKGIRNRLVLAIVMSVIAILVDSYLVYTNYDYLPSNIGTWYDWDSIATVTEHKSVFWKYELQRIVGLLVFIVAGWMVYARNKKSLIRFRTFTAIVETANLVILTCVGISIIMLTISIGDQTRTVSDYWEAVVMYIWFIILLIEYISDIRFLKKENEAK